MEKEVDDVTSPYSIITATSDSSTPRPTSPTPEPSTPEPSAIPRPSTPGSSISTRKRKCPTKTDGAVIEIIEKMLERQSQSDMKVMELEEKRMLLEEKALEREMQQRREDREFQMKFFQMLMVHSNHSYYPPTNMPMVQPPFTPPSAGSGQSLNKPVKISI